MNGKALLSRRYGVIMLLLAAWVGWFCGSKWNSEILRPATAAEPGAQGELTQLLKARYETAARLLQLENKRLQEGVTTLGRVCEVARWVRDSAVELPGTAGERLTVLTNYVALARQLEQSIERANRSGAASLADKEAARYLRLDAEVTLLRAQQHVGP